MSQTKSKFNSSIILTVALLAVVCYFCVSFFNLRAEIADKTAEVKALEQQVEQQQAQNIELEQLLENGDLDAFVEKRARDEDLGYVYPDERVYYDLAAEQ